MLKGKKNKGWGKYTYESSCGIDLEENIWDTWSYSSTGFKYKYYKSRIEVKDNEETLLKKEKIKEAYDICLDLIKILDLPSKTSLIVDTRSDSYRNNEKCIFLPTKAFDSDVYSDREKINIVCGLGLHESFHAKYTKHMSYCCSIKDKQYLWIVIFNLLEDLKVEHLALEERPGFFKQIQMSINYNTELLKNSDGWCNTRVLNESNKFYANLISLIRFPDLIDDSFIEEYSVFSDIKKLLKDVPRLTVECAEITDNIYNLLVDNEDYSINYGKNYNSIDSFLRKIRSYLYNDIYSFEDEYNKNDLDTVSCCKVSRLVMNDTIFRKELQNELEISDNDKKTILQKIRKSDSSEYDLVKNSILDLIGPTRNILKNLDVNYNFNIPSCRSGILDTNKLVEAVQGVPQVYFRRGVITTTGADIAFLIDESGSMERENKLLITRKASVLINESFNNIPGVNLYIYGHTADCLVLESDNKLDCNNIRCNCRTSLLIYKEADFYNPINVCHKIKGLCENRDGTAILEVSKRIRKFTKNHVSLFVLSDGIPAASDYQGYEAKTDVKEKVSIVEKDNFDVIQLNIGTEIRENDMKYMFNNYAYIKSIEDFPLVLKNMAYKIILKNKESHLTIM